MKALLAWLLSGAVTAVLALAISSTLFGNRGDEDSSWTGGSAPLLAFGAGVLPMTLVHAGCFLWLRRGDPLPLRMARATTAGLVAFGLGLAALIFAAHHS